jgi:hypothetical protein
MCPFLLSWNLSFDWSFRHCIHATDPKTGVYIIEFAKLPTLALKLERIKLAFERKIGEEFNKCFCADPNLRMERIAEFKEQYPGYLEFIFERKTLLTLLLFIG